MRCKASWIKLNTLYCDEDTETLGACIFALCYMGRGSGVNENPQMFPVEFCLREREVVRPSMYAFFRSLIDWLIDWLISFLLTYLYHYSYCLLSYLIYLYGLFVFIFRLSAVFIFLTSFPFLPFSLIAFPTFSRFRCFNFCFSYSSLSLWDTSWELEKPKGITCCGSWRKKSKREAKKEIHG